MCTSLFELTEHTCIHHRKLADTVAERGPYYVVAPDYFHGDALTNIADLDAFVAKHRSFNTHPVKSTRFWWLSDVKVATGLDESNMLLRCFE